MHESDAVTSPSELLHYQDHEVVQHQTAAAEWMDPFIRFRMSISSKLPLLLTRPWPFPLCWNVIRCWAQIEAKHLQRTLQVKEEANREKSWSQIFARSPWMCSEDHHHIYDNWLSPYVWCWWLCWMLNICCTCRRSISSIRGELVPYLVRKQFSKTTNSQKIKDDTEDQNQKKTDGSASHGQCLHTSRLHRVRRKTDLTVTALYHI